MIPEKLQYLIDDFQECVGAEKLDYLLELAESLPALPARLQAASEEVTQVHECLTPVFLHSEFSDGTMIFYFDVPPGSPTVRGFASLMMEGINGTKPNDILQIPAEFFLQTGLQHALSPQRMNGLGTFLAYMKREATKHI